jgi:hypothetical protein
VAVKVSETYKLLAVRLSMGWATMSNVRFVTVLTVSFYRSIGPMRFATSATASKGIDWFICF